MRPFFLFLYRSLLVVGLMCFASPILAQTPPPAVPGNVIVKFSGSTKSLGGSAIPPAALAVLSTHGAHVEQPLFASAGGAGKAARTPATQGIYLVKVADPADTADTIAALQALPEVLYAEPDFIYTLDFIPNDPDFNRQWHLQNTGQFRLAGADVDAPGAWDVSQGVNAPVIAIIDTGIDLSHPDLVNKIWTNPKEQPGDANGDGRPGFANFDDDGDGLIDEDSAGRQPGDPGYTNNLKNDDDENGFVDDVRGWDWVNGDAVPNDEQGHGTHCAGIAAAETNNGIGIAGMCPTARIMPLKVFQVDGTASTSNIVQAIQYASLNGASVVSMSFGGPGSTAMKDALDVAYSTSVLVAASGNGGEAEGARYPAGYGTVIGVGASDIAFNAATGQYEEVIAEFTNTTNADLCAPGVNIYSTLPGDNYASWSGTSMATPVVAGIAAILVSWRNGEGFWGPDQYRSMLVEAAGELVSKRVITVEDGSPQFETRTLPRISASRALTMDPYPRLVVAGTSISDPTGDGDNRADAGETVSLVVTLKNEFGNAENVVCTLSTDDPFLTVSDSVASFGSIGPSGTETNASSPFTLSVDSNAPHNRVSRLILAATASNADAIATQEFYITVQHGKTLSGLMSADLTLVRGAEYLVPDNYIVPSGKKLTIQPGVTLKFYSGAQLIIDGTLVAIGTPTEPIVMKANDPAKGWAGVLFGDLSRDAVVTNGTYVSGSTLQYGIISDVTSQRAIHCVQTSPYIARNRIQDCQVRALYSTLSSKPYIVQNIFYGNIYGLDIQGGPNSDGMIVSDNLVIGNLSNPTWGVVEISQVEIIFTGNAIIGNKGTGASLVLVASTIYPPTVSGNIIETGETNPYALKLEGGDADVRNNYWGPAMTAELDRVGPNANVSKIYDRFDNGLYGFATYSPYLTSPPSMENTPPFVVSATIPAVVGGETFDVVLTVNRDMDTSVPLALSFGPAEPYTQKLITTGEWISPRQWRGSYKATLFTGDGIQHLRVAGGRDAGLGMSMPPDTRFKFEVDAAGLSGLGLQASGEAGRVDLYYQAVDEPDVAGYNIYRSNTLTGTYSKLNSAVVYDTRYSDLTAPEGQTRYYKVAAVRTDFSQSPLSDVASAAALDGTAPVVTHTGIAGPLVLPIPGVSIQATITDNVGVKGARLYWKSGTDDRYTSETMLNPTAGKYTFSLAAEDVLPPQLSYYIEAEDALGNVGRFASAASPHTIIVRTANNQPPTVPGLRPVLHVALDPVSTDPETGPVRYRYEWKLDDVSKAIHGPTPSTEDTLREDGLTISFSDGQTWTVLVTPIDIEDMEGPTATGTFKLGPGGAVVFRGWTIR